MEWAETQDRAMPFKVGHFEWCDDFAAARNAADDLLETDWLVWADADDVIVGAQRLRPGIREQAAQGVHGIVFDYVGGDGMLTQRLRARSRNLKLRWEGRLHEGLDEAEIPADRLRLVDQTDGVFWCHRTVAKHDRMARNLRIMERWIAEEPADPRPYAMLGEFRLRFEGDRRAAAEAFERYLDLRGEMLADPADARLALRELRSDPAADVQELNTRIVGFWSAATGVRSRKEKEAGLSRQQRRALARRREKEQRRIERLAAQGMGELVICEEAA